MEELDDLLCGVMPAFSAQTRASRQEELHDPLLQVNFTRLSHGNEHLHYLCFKYFSARVLNHSRAPRMPGRDV